MKESYEKKFITVFAFVLVTLLMIGVSSAG